MIINVHKSVNSKEIRTPYDFEETHVDIPDWVKFNLIKGVVEGCDVCVPDRSD